MPTAAVLTDGLGKRYGDFEALRDLDLEVAPGEVIGYLGPNGSGKTTTIRLLLGLLRPTAGRSSIFGLDSHRQTVAAHRRLAFVPGEAALWPELTGGEVLHLLGRMHGSVDQAYLAELLERFALDPGRKVRSYSKGNRQKVILVAALMTRADLLLLDEPTSGLDPLMEQEFRSCVREAQGRGQTVFLSSHSLSEVDAVCGRVAILRAGRLVEVGELSDLRHLAAYSIDVSFDGEAPDLSAVSGVSSISVDGSSLRAQVAGSFEPVLKALAAYRVTRLTSREPSLEEMFLRLYGKDAEEGTGSTTASGGGADGHGS